MSRFRVFPVLCLAAGLLCVQPRTSEATIYLTVNGEDRDSVELNLGSPPCTIEIQSTDNNAYAAFVGFEWDPLGQFGYTETRPEAGTDSWVEPWVESPLSYGFLVAAGGAPSPGVHFVFWYMPEQHGQVMLGLWDSDLNLVDAVWIAVLYPPDFGACCDKTTGYCNMSYPWECWYTWLGQGSDCSMCQPQQEFGACCDEMSGYCYMSHPWECSYKWLGPGSDCSMCQPPPQQGGCCDQTTGYCQMSYQMNCPYNWLGPGSDCGMCQPPLQPGACCDKCTGNCYVSEIWDCIYDWLGPGTDCSLCVGPPEIKVEIHTVKGSGITEGQIREWIDKANQIDCPDVRFVVDSNHVYEPNTPYDPNKNERCKINIWGLRKCVATADGTDLDYVSGRKGKVVELVPGKTDPCDPNGLNVYIKDSTLAHELNHIFLGPQHSTDPNNKMYADNRRNERGKFRSCNRKGADLTSDQRKKLKEGVVEFGKARDATIGEYGDETYDDVGDVSFEYIDLDWTQGWIESIQNMYLFHLTVQVKTLSFGTYSELGFYIESDNCQSTGQPPEGLDYYMALQPADGQIIFMIYETQWMPLDPTGILYEYTYIDKDANVPPIPAGVRFVSFRQGCMK